MSESTKYTPPDTGILDKNEVGFVTCGCGQRKCVGIHADHSTGEGYYWCRFCGSLISRHMNGRSDVYSAIDTLVTTQGRDRELILSAIKKWTGIANGESPRDDEDPRCDLCHRYLDGPNRCSGCPLFENGFGCLEEGSIFNRYCEVGSLPWTTDRNEQLFACARIMLNYLNVCLIKEDIRELETCLKKSKGLPILPELRRTSDKLVEICDLVNFVLRSGIR